MTRRIRCAHCKCAEGHQTVAQVKLCGKRIADAKAAEEAADLEGHLQQQAEAAAELRNERWFEERGGAEDDPRERELQALEDMRADAIIAARKAHTMQVFDRWTKANPAKRLNSYGCIPYITCNCPTSFRMCSAFEVLDRFEENEHDAMIAAREIAEDRAVAQAKMDRGFTLGGTRRRRPW